MRFWTLACALLLLACGDGDEQTLNGPTGDLAVTQAGAQDIAHFRDLLEDGAVPARSTLDQRGFFAEHALTQPPADCDASVCAHAQLAVAPRFDEGNWTMAFVSMNSPVLPHTREREPVHLAIVVEMTTRTSGVSAPIVAGIEELLDRLPAGDRVTLVTARRSAAVAIEAEDPATAAPALNGRWSDTQAALYDGLALAVDAITRDAAPLPNARILLLTSGRADAGITDPDRLLALTAGAARAGIGMSIVGVGDSYDAAIPSALAGLGTATLSRAQDADEVRGLIAAQADLSLVPLATDFELTVRPAEGYRVGSVFGAAAARRDGRAVVLEAPAIFLGARSGPQDVDEEVGRRGGGGGIFVSLIAEPDAADTIGPDAPAFTAEVRYLDADSGREVETEQVVRNALPPGENPEEFWPHFSEPDHAKAFMMLNMYVAMAYALELYEQGRCEEAMGAIEMMDVSVDGWQERYDDADIQADDELMLLLRANIADQCKASPVPPATFPEAGCFGI